MREGEQRWCATAEIDCVNNKVLLLWKKFYLPFQTSDVFADQIRFIWHGIKITVVAFFYAKGNMEVNGNIINRR